MYCSKLCCSQFLAQPKQGSEHETLGSQEAKVLMRYDCAVMIYVLLLWLKLYCYDLLTKVSIHTLAVQGSKGSMQAQPSLDSTFHVSPSDMPTLLCHCQLFVTMLSKSTAACGRSTLQLPNCLCHIYTDPVCMCNLGNALCDMPVPYVMCTLQQPTHHHQQQTGLL